MGKYKSLMFSGNPTPSARELMFTNPPPPRPKKRKRHLIRRAIITYFVLRGIFD